MKRKINSILLTVLGFAFSLSLLSLVAMRASAGVGILQDDAAVASYAAYNLNNGEGEISRYSYRAITNEKVFESFGNGYGGYFISRNRWQEAPVLLETVSAATSAEYAFGTSWRDEFTLVGRGLNTLYSEAGEKARDYSSLSLRFGDGNGEVLVVLTQSSDADTITPTVFLDGFEVKLETDSIASSLCGKSGGKDYPLYISFDGTSGMLTTRNDDGRQIDSVICDLKEFGFTPFGYYSASLIFGGKAQSVTDENNNRYSAKGRFLVYELCGQNMTGVAVNTKGAQLGAVNAASVYLGATYTPDPGIAFDVLDGDISDKIVLQITDPDGEAVALRNGRLTAEKEGEYTLFYKVADSGGIETTAEYKLQVLSALPGIGAVLEKEYPAVCGVGEKIPISAIALTTAGVELGDYNVIVMKDGRTTDLFYGGESGYFTAAEVGTYSVVYVVNNGVGLLSSFTYTVECGNVPVFEIDDIPAELAFNVEYALGDPLVRVGGEIVRPEIEITAPDGSATLIEGNSFVPSQLGEYTIRFYVGEGGYGNERVCRVRSAITNKNLLTSVVGLGDKRENVTATVYDRTVNGNTVSKTLTEKSGVLLAGSSSDQVFRFNNVLDFNTMSATTPIFNFSVLAGGVYGQLSELEVRLIDKYDPSNYLLMYWYQAADDYYCYTRAGASGRLFGRSNETGKYENVWTTTFGTVTMNSMCGSRETRPIYGESRYNTFNYYLDYENMILRVANARVWQYGEFFPVVDLDDPDMVGTGNVWNGFTTGEAYLEVKLPGSLSKPIGILVFDVGGQSLGGTAVSDVTAPVLAVDTTYVNRLPDALINKAYVLPSAEANDLVCGPTAVTVTVVGPDGTIEAENGKVTLATVGEYKVRYFCTDVFGNKAERIFTFEAKSSIDPITISWAESPENYTAGETVVIPQININGGSGNPDNVVIKAEYNGEEISVPVSGRITLTQVGTIQFTLVSADDYIGTEIGGEPLSLTVLPPDKVTLEVSGVPDKFIVGNTAYLPVYSAYDYAFASDESGFEPDVTVYINGELHQSSSFVVPDAAYVEFRFEAGKGSRAAELILRVPTCAPQSLADYFSGNAASYELTADGLAIYGVGNTEARFINPIVADQLQLRLNVDPARIPNSISIIMRDYIDAGEEVVFKITPYNETLSYLEVNGSGKFNRINGTFSNINEYFGFLFSNDGMIRDVRSSLGITVGEFSNGEPFTGFSSGLVSITFRFEATGNGSVMVYSISNQVFDLYSYVNGEDITLPALLFESRMQTQEVAKGESFIVSAAKAYDVLNLYGTVTVRVTGPDESGVVRTLYEDRAADESFAVEAKNYGVYSVFYTATDEFGNSSPAYVYRYTVTDRVAPEIHISGQIKSVYAVGEKLVLPQIVVSDNYDSAPKLIIMIYNASTRYTPVTAGEAIALKRGDCKLVIYAYDANYNMTEIEYNFEVR